MVHNPNYVRKSLYKLPIKYRHVTMDNDTTMFYLISLSKIVVSLVVHAKCTGAVLYKMYLTFKHLDLPGADKYFHFLACRVTCPISLLFWGITCWVGGMAFTVSFFFMFM